MRKRISDLLEKICAGSVLVFLFQDGKGMMALAVSATALIFCLLVQEWEDDANDNDKQ